VTRRRGLESATAGTGLNAGRAEYQLSLAYSREPRSFSRAPPRPRRSFASISARRPHPRCGADRGHLKVMRSRDLRRSPWPTTGPWIEHEIDLGGRSTRHQIDS
jgi:hypothetical protein